MDLSRYLDVATRGRLFFSRQDKFRDTYEGAIPSMSRQALALQSKQIEAENKKSAELSGVKKRTPSMEVQMMNLLESTRRKTFISCWHMNRFCRKFCWSLSAGIGRT
jgi:hypothetical protein